MIRCLCVTLGAALLAAAYPNAAQAAPTPRDWLEPCRLNQSAFVPSVSAQCGQLDVPLNPDEPSGATLTLEVAVIPALNINPAADPLVLIAGGPGQSTIEFYLASQNAFAAVRLEREIILVDQRGTGRSNPLVCDTGNDEMMTPETIDEVAAAASVCLDGLNADPRYFTTSVAVRDLDAVRTALGVQAVNVYGVSYGTRVAQHFMRRFPDSTRRVILDGVVHPELVLGPGIAIDAQRALSNLFARCSADSACAERYGDLTNRFASLLETLQAAPVALSLADPVTGEQREFVLGDDELGAAMRLLSYSPLTSALLPLLIDEAANGNYQPLAAQVAMVERDLSGMLNLGMHNAVVCTEDMPFYEPDATEDAAIAKSYLGRLNIDSLQAICDVWPAGFIDDDFREPLTSDIPTLLLSGENDPVTPPTYADVAAQQLRQSQHIVGPDYGHGLAGHGCVPTLMAAFLDDEEPLPVEASCVDKLAVMPFFIDYAGPAR
ncbi:MAG: alpha/beta hydrolase [Pseudomonadota bacterium]